MCEEDPGEGGMVFGDGSGSGSNNENGKDDDDNNNDNIENNWHSSVTRITVASYSNIDLEYGMSEIALHPIALHAIDTTSLHIPKRNIKSSQELEPDPELDLEPRPQYDNQVDNHRLYAYGGAAGLIRIHSINILKDIVGINSRLE